jgi:hypothetical protein
MVTFPSTLMTKETWTDQIFDSINWVGCGTAFKRPPPHGKHKQRCPRPTITCVTQERSTYNNDKPCCMCSAAHGDFQHILSCPSCNVSYSKHDVSVHTMHNFYVRTERHGGDFRPRDFHPRDRKRKRVEHQKSSNRARPARSIPFSNSLTTDQRTTW